MEAQTLATTWAADITHSQITFKAKHLVITTVSGSFKNFEAQLVQNGSAFENASASFTAQVNSITTNNEQRDGHLQSPDFFDAASFPTLSFESTDFVSNGSNNYTVTGNLTIKDKTQPISFSAEYLGSGKDPWGNEKIAFNLSGKINRTDFGLTWNAPLETGGVLVSEEIKIEGEFQFVKTA